MQYNLELNQSKTYKTDHVEFLIDEISQEIDEIIRGNRDIKLDKLRKKDCNAYPRVLIENLFNRHELHNRMVANGGKPRKPRKRVAKIMCECPSCLKNRLNHKNYFEN